MIWIIFSGKFKKTWKIMGFDIFECCNWVVSSINLLLWSVHKVEIKDGSLQPEVF